MQLHRFRPRLLDALKGYDGATVRARCRRRAHRGHRRAAAGHGLCHRLGRQARGRHLHRHHCRLPDQRAGRLQRADRRAGRRLHRHRLRHRRTLRPGQPADRHLAGRRAAVRDGAVQAGRAGALRAGADHHRLHQRHRGADRAVAAEGPVRPAHRQDALGLLRADPGAVARTPPASTRRRWPSARPAWRWWCCGPSPTPCRSTDRAVGQAAPAERAPAGHHHRAGAGHRSPRRCSTCRSRPSARASAASRSRCRPLHCPS